jgi:hypothetical protein
MLVDLLEGDEAAPVYLLRLWAHCQNRKGWQFQKLTAHGIKAICRFGGSPDLLEASLAECGFISREGSVVSVCSWDEYNASLISSWNNGGKGGRPRKQPAENPTDNPPKTHGFPDDNPPKTRTEPIREEKNREEEKREEKELLAASYDSEPMNLDPKPERSSKQPLPDLEERNGFPSIDHFLGLAAVAGIPEDFATALHCDMTAQGWIAGNGKPVGSLSMFLRAAWDRAKPRENAPRIEGGPRQAWQIDADIARVQAEIKRLNSDAGRKNSAHGHTESRDDYRRRREPEYLATVKGLMAQAKAGAITQAEWENFERSLANLRDEMRKGANLLGVAAKEVDSEDVAAVHFAEFFPTDCPDFELWDREWTESTWKDPNALTAEAKVEVRELKAALKRLEGERRRALV